ncbi:hypothetical protein HY995_05930 [Candidatus Micrarchaeota archaeon]|nr:hypothetical protein [Candidatus Micrarchaeota archaeon]
MALVTLQERIASVIDRIAENFVSGIADFVVLLIFLAVGYIVARFFAAIVRRGLYEARLERKLREKGMDDALLGFTLTDIIVTTVKISTFAVFLGIGADVTRLGFLNTVILWVLGYLPHFIEGVVIITGAMLAVDYIVDRIKKAHDIPFPGFLGVAMKVFVGYTALVISMPLILPGADVEILKTFFTLVIGAFALAVGLGGAIALGLGMKEAVESVSKEKKNELRKLIH